MLDYLLTDNNTICVSKSQQTSSNSLKTILFLQVHNKSTIELHLCGNPAQFCCIPTGTL